MKSKRYSIFIIVLTLNLAFNLNKLISNACIHSYTLLISYFLIYCMSLDNYVLLITKYLAHSVVALLFA